MKYTLSVIWFKWLGLKIVLATSSYETGRTLWFTNRFVTSVEHKLNQEARYLFHESKDSVTK